MISNTVNYKFIFLATRLTLLLPILESGKACGGHVNLRAGGARETRNLLYYQLISLLLHCPFLLFHFSQFSKRRQPFSAPVTPLYFLLFTFYSNFLSCFANFGDTYSLFGFSHLFSLIQITATSFSTLCAFIRYSYHQLLL